MKAWGKRSLGVVCVLLALLGIASSAAAKPAGHVVPGSFEIAFQPPRSHGYLIAVKATGHHRIELVAGRDGILTSYTVWGRASSRGVWANFGKFGRLRVRFHETKSVAVPPRRQCTGHAGHAQGGEVTGKIKFRGEHGYIRVSTDHAIAGFQRTFRQVCHRHRASPFARKDNEPTLAEKPAAILEAAKRAHGRETFFDMFELGFGVGSLIVAGTSERVGQVGVSKVTLGGAEAKSFDLSAAGEQPVTAKVHLSKPFSGKGFFVEEPDSEPSWNGSLALNVPGLPGIPLAGPGFRTALCVARSVKQIRRCGNEPTLVPRSVEKLAFSLAQGSGSHSQVFADARLSWSR